MTGLDVASAALASLWLLSILVSGAGAYLFGYLFIDTARNRQPGWRFLIASVLLAFAALFLYVAPRAIEINDRCGGAR